MQNLKTMMENLKVKFEDSITFENSNDGRIIVLIGLNRFSELILVLASLNFDQLVSITGIDYPSEKSIVCAYHLVSTSGKKLIEVKTSTKRNEGVIPSVMNSYPNADWFEREIHEMFGLNFEGNPNMGRLLLPEDWNQGFPLRKDFKLHVGD
ncbi:MAG: NADH-quinone oxidoreductase subunit C [Candidatus Bathyarchaeia archaeon]